MAGRKNQRAWGHVRKLPSGRFQAKYKGPDGLTYTARTPAGGPLTFDNNAHADKYLAKVRTAISDGKWTSPDAQRAATIPTLEEFWLGWIERKTSTLAPRTAQQYKWLWTTRIEPAFGQVRLDAIMPMDVTNWHHKLADAPSAQAQAYSLLASMMRDAVAHWPRTLFTPCVVKAGGTSPARTKNIVILDRDQLAELCAALPEKYRAPVQVMYWGGLRYGELAGLQRGDCTIFDTHAVITIRRSIVRLAKTGLQEGPTKSEAGGRRVILPPKAAAALQGHLDAYVGASDDSWVLTAQTGGPMPETSFAKHFKKAAAAIAVPTLSPHMLRHAANVIRELAGASREQRLAMQGHTSDQVNALYRHETPEHRARLISSLAEMEIS